MLVVGFAAETDDLLANAAEKLRRKGLDLIVLNDVGAPGVGMGADDNAVTVLDRDGVVLTVERSPKLEVARRLVALAGERLARRPRADRPDVLGRDRPGVPVDGSVRQDPGATSTLCT